MTTSVANMVDGFAVDAVYIGRAGRGFDGYYGNPFRLGVDGERAQVIAKYRDWFYHRLDVDPAFGFRVELLRGKALMCFCAPLACHGDVIAEYLNGLNDG